MSDFVRLLCLVYDKLVTKFALCFKHIESDQNRLKQYSNKKDDHRNSW